MIVIKNIQNNKGATYFFVIIIVLILLLQLTLLISLTINSRSLTSAHSDNINRKIFSNSSIEKVVDMLNKTLNAAEEGNQTYNTVEAFEKTNSNLDKRFKSINGSTYETRFEVTFNKDSSNKKVYAITVTVIYLSKKYEITSTVTETRFWPDSAKYTSKAKASVMFDELTQTLYIESMNTLY